jgi:murein DD-endopeptidase MepM/ murein hydrolase activator NlpD
VTFPSFQVKNQPDKRICLFTVPPDAGTGAAPVLFARSESGVEVTAALPHRVRGRRFRERTIALGDRLLRRILDELDPGGAGGAAERFDRLAALRWENDRRLAALSRKSGAKRLWNGAFLLPPRSKVLSRFGDAGTYMSAGKPVLRERHMGLDMASVRNAPVPAANAGTVVFAGRLGVYGNCIAIDHGLGVLTVYSHLSRIDVRTGQAVEQGAEIGATGMTGLAAGDHLHLGVMVGGVFVDRVEWEDGHWMEASLAPVLNELD